MGNLCSWCLKNQDQSQVNENRTDNHGPITNSERSLERSDFIDERTPLIGKSDMNNHVSSTMTSYPTVNGDSSMIAPQLSSQFSHETRIDTTTVPNNETAETKMAFIVEGMLSKLIDVGGSNIPSNNSHINESNISNDQLRHAIHKSLSSTSLFALPDAGLNNLPSLLSGRPISSDICHFVAQTAGELSRLLIEEIKIIHKEDLVVVFE